MGHASKWYTQRRYVVVGKHVPKGSRLFAFGYEDLADFLGVTKQTIRNMVHRGELDPTDLESILAARLRSRKGV